MRQRVPKGFSDKNSSLPYVEDHPHDLVIWDDKRWDWICTTCGEVLQGAPPTDPSFTTEVPGNFPPVSQNKQDQLDIEILDSGSIIGDLDIASLSPEMQKLFKRLLRAHRNTIAKVRHEKSKSQFYNFYCRLLKFPKFRETFPPPKLEQLLNTFENAVETITEQCGRKLQQTTRIRIFLVLIEPELDPKVFKAILQRFEIGNDSLYEIKKQVFLFLRNHKAVNGRKKEEFISKAKDLIMEAAIDPEVRAEALDILSKRAQFGGLVIRKSANVLAAAAIYVAGRERLSRNKARKAVNASYLPPDAITDCKQVLNVNQEDFQKTVSQKTLLTALKKRDRLLQTRRALLTKLSIEAERAFPGIKRILTIRNVSSRRFLKQYSSTNAIVTLTLDEIAQFLRKQSRGRLKNINRIANQLLTAAQKLEMVGRRPRPGNFLQIQSLLTEFDQVEQERIVLERTMRDALGEEGKRLMKTRGVGLVTASRLLVSRSPKIAILTHKSFFERSLKLAFQSLQRNHTIQQRYPLWAEQKRPQLEILQKMTETLIQAGPSPLV